MTTRRSFLQGVTVGAATIFLPGIAFGGMDMAPSPKEDEDLVVRIPDPRALLVPWKFGPDSFEARRDANVLAQRHMNESGAAYVSGYLTLLRGGVPLHSDHVAEYNRTWTEGWRRGTSPNAIGCGMTVLYRDVRRPYLEALSDDETIRPRSWRVETWSHQDRKRYGYNVQVHDEIQLIFSTRAHLSDLDPKSY